MKLDQFVRGLGRQEDCTLAVITAEADRRAQVQVNRQGVKVEASKQEPRVAIKADQY